MPKTKNRASRSAINKPVVWLTAAIIVVAALGTYYLARPASDSGSSNGSGTSSGQIKKPFKQGGHSLVAQGGAIDNKGAGVAKTPSNDWTSSASGNITLMSPVTGALVKSGDTISGTAKVSTVQYRLVDDTVGVLAQGPLSVVGGKFSGKLSFEHQANTGKLDIFSYNSSGAEINSISIKIKLEP